MTEIKICGLSRPEDIEYANELRPDYVGFVFAAGRRRTISPERAAALRARLDGQIPAVGVFVREEPDRIAALLESGIIQIAQLHGGEDEAFVRALKARTGAPVWQAFRVAGPEDLERACASSADRILLDNGPGGTGCRFDWGLLRDFDARPYILAGGLDARSVGGAIRALRPLGVDVSSGVETDGAKDRRKIQEFIQAVREAEI